MSTIECPRLGEEPFLTPLSRPLVNSDGHATLGISTRAKNTKKLLSRVVLLDGWYSPHFLGTHLHARAYHSCVWGAL